MSVGLRPVRDEDIEIFYEHQNEPEGAAMAMFPSRDHDAFFSHWRRTRARTDARTMTITYGNAVAGNIATAALNAYVTEHEPRRPLRAHVAATNTGSIRVLEKCGFELVSRTTEFNPAFGVDVEELLMEYRPGAGGAP